MIIAIMGATYDRVRDSKESNEREMKIAILSDYIKHIRHSKDANVPIQNSFLVVVMSDEENFSSSEFDGTINMIRTSISSA